MPIEQYTYWSITINNPDDNDKLIIQNPNEKYIRSLVWTPEVGEEGTDHIQGWVRLQRNQSLAFMKKLYPRAHVKPCDKDVYNENCHQYAQKNDDTTAGNHHITLHDPLPANDTLLYKVLEKSFESMLENEDRLRDHYEHDGIDNVITRITLKKLDTDFVEREMIKEKAGLEKIIISPAYEKMKSKFWKEILIRLFRHKEDVEQRSISTKGDETTIEDQTGSAQVCSDYEESTSETYEGPDESTSDEDGENSDF